jgi:hypothetical protein
MLKRFRIEVEAESPETAADELWKYEHVLQVAEAERYGLGYTEQDFVVGFNFWAATIEERSFYNERLGREIHEEVIEYDPKLPGYRARRVVAFTRADNRSPLAYLDGPVPYTHTAPPKPAPAGTVGYSESTV